MGRGDNKRNGYQQEVWGVFLGFPGLRIEGERGYFFTDVGVSGAGWIELKG